MTEQLHAFAVIVHNQPGVLARVAGLLSRRGFNIESLAVGETTDPTLSRMTIVVKGDRPTMEQVAKQLARLVEVVKVSDLSRHGSLELEMTMIKVRAKPAKRQRIIDVVSRFYAEIIDAGPKSMIIVAVGDAGRTWKLIEILRPLGIVELARTGRLAMSRCHNGDEGREVGFPTPNIYPVGRFFSLDGAQAEPQPN